MNLPKHIVIATGIYPPEIGGPAEYARQLFENFLIQRYEVSVMTYGNLKRFTTGIRHMLYFFNLAFNHHDADYIIALDTFSVALPVIAFSKIFGAKTCIRVAGDFLWETHVERVKEPILLSEFYTKPRKYSFKERIIFLITRFVLRNTDMVVFSTEWQKNIMKDVYKLRSSKICVIENFYTNVHENVERIEDSEKKVFLSPSRDRYIKNKTKLEEAWKIVSEKYSDIELDTKIVSHEMLEEKMKGAYAVIVPSLSEVSPNMVLDGISNGIPSVVTQDVGIKDRLEGVSVFIDPTSVEDIARGIEEILQKDIYERYKSEIFAERFAHSWNEIGQEYIDIYQKI